MNPLFKMISLIAALFSAWMLQCHCVSGEEKSIQSKEVEKEVSDLQDEIMRIWESRTWANDVNMIAKDHLNAMKEGIALGVKAPVPVEKKERFLNFARDHVKSIVGSYPRSQDDPSLRYSSQYLKWIVPRYLQEDFDPKQTELTIQSIDKLCDRIVAEWKDFPLAAFSEQDPSIPGSRVHSFLEKEVARLRGHLKSRASGLLSVPEFHVPFSDAQIDEIGQFARELRNWPEYARAELKRLGARQSLGLSLLFDLRRQMNKKLEALIVDDRPEWLRKLANIPSTYRGPRKRGYSLGPETIANEQLRFWLFQMLAPAVGYTGNDIVLFP